MLPNNTSFNAFQEQFMNKIMLGILYTQLNFLSKDLIFAVGFSYTISSSSILCFESLKEKPQLKKHKFYVIWDFSLISCCLKLGI